MKKVYVRFEREHEDEPDADPPVSKIWDDGSKPSRKCADGRTYVYDQTPDGQMKNERVWDGKE